MDIQQKEKRFPSAAGNCDIRVRYWIPEEIRGAVQLTHGMAEHIDRYQEFALFLARNGFLVYGHDQAGHGKSIPSEGIPGFFREEDGWTALTEDMRRIFLQVRDGYPAIPFVLFGHSMGSFLARTYASRHPEDFDAFVFCGTAGRNPILWAGRMIAKREIRKTGGKIPSEKLAKLMFGSYNRRIPSPRTSFDWLSVNERNVDAYVADPLCGFPFTACAVRDLMDGLAEIGAKDWAGKVPKKPILLIAGAEDPVGAYGKGPEQVRSALAKTGHTADLKLYPDMRHEILQEDGREDVYRDVLLFLEAVAAGGEME